MRFAILSSGSAGNASIVQAGDTAIMVDCGLSLRTLEKRAASIGFDLSDLNAIVVTHEHSDHISGVSLLARRYAKPVFMTRGTRSAAPDISAEVHEISPHRAFSIGAFDALPAPVPHDAREPCQFVFEHDDVRVGILTDLGSDTRYLREHFSSCDALVMEFNHDRSMLQSCDYPDALKARIASREGHFNNEQSRDLLEALCSPRLRHVTAAHISQRANAPEIVRSILERLLDGSQTAWDLAHQDRAGSWISLK